jgi:uncharacterized membrane protein
MVEQLHVPEDDEALTTRDSDLPEQVVGELIAEQVERAAKRAVAHIVSTSVSFSGPIPPPAMLAGYEKVLPGAADRMLRMTENEQNFRHETKRSEIGNENARARMGQCYAFGIAVLFLIVSAALIYTGHDWAGGILGTVDLVALATVFVTGKYFSAREEKDRTKILAEALRHHGDDEDDED